MIRAEPGATPIVLKVQLGTNGDSWSYSTDGPDDLTLSGFKLTWGLEVWSDAANIIVDRMDGGSFFVGGRNASEGPRSITIRNSDWGPCTPSGSFQGVFSGCRHFFEGDERSGQPRIVAGVQNMLVENNAFHDMIIDYPDAHWECVWVGGGTNITFRSNRFDNCETNAIALGDERLDTNVAGTWIFENNWCGRVSEINGCFKFGGLPYAGNLIFRFNTFAPGSSIEDEENGNAQGRITIVSNILGEDGCISGALYSYNLFPAGGTCALTDRQSIFGYAFDGTRLVRDPRTADSVRSVFVDLITGKAKSLRLLARRLSRERKVAPSGGWSAGAVRLMVSDRTYLGGRVGIQGRHPGLVTRKEWREANRIVAALGG